MVFALVFFGVRYYQQAEMPKGIAPPVVGITLDGQGVSLEKSAKPVLLHFWATWCKICEWEQGTIESLAKDYAVISIAIQSGDNEKVKNYIKERGISFPVINDTFGQFAMDYGVRGVPSSFVIDKNGVIRAVEVGYTSEIGLRLRLWWASLTS
ncbi:MAG: protein disulfide oxidoreductase [Acidiferrobacterales bacterium]